MPRSDDRGPDRAAARAAARARTELGRRGESAAAEWLAARGYAVIGRNVRVGSDEADIVAIAPGGSLAVVEVKARRGAWHPEERVDHVKRARMARLAEALLATDAWRDRLVQFDVVAVGILEDGRHEVIHWPCAFDAPRGHG